MKIGIIGPGQVDKYCKRAKISNEKYTAIVREIAGFIASMGNEIIVTPDKGSTSELFAKEYKEAGGEKVNVLVPLDDKEFGYEWVNLDIADKKINCRTWRNQPESICENSDMFICIGWGGGTLAEIYYTRWFRKVKHTYVVKELIDSKLPESLDKTFRNFEYISVPKLKEKLR